MAVLGALHNKLSDYLCFHSTAPRRLRIFVSWNEMQPSGDNSVFLRNPILLNHSLYAYEAEGRFRFGVCILKQMPQF